MMSFAGKLCLQLAFIISSLFASVGTAATEVRVTLWDRQIIFKPDDRAILRVDGKNYRLPQEAAQVPKTPIEPSVRLIWGGAGDFADATKIVSFENYIHPGKFERTTNCFLADSVIQEGNWNFPLDMTPAEIGHLNSCGVVMVRIGPILYKGPQHIGGENKAIGRILRLEPVIWVRTGVTQELSLTEVRARILTYGEPAAVRYFLTKYEYSKDVVNLIIDYSGAFFGKGPLLATCNAGYATERIYGERCIVEIRPENNWLFSEIRFYCPCAHSVEWLLRIDSVLSGRLRQFLPVGDER